MIKLLVTGSRGLIGRGLIQRLLLKGYEVSGLDWSYPSDHPHYGDLRDPRTLTKAVDGCNGIIHLAAISRVAWGERDPALCNAVNAGGTQRLWDAAKAQEQKPWFILASSREVYGEPDRLPVREDAERHPFNAYGHSKLASERIIERDSQALRHAILRFANVYGAVHDHPDRVVPAFLRNAISGERLQVHGADNAFDFTHVEDVLRGILMAAGQLIDGDKSLPPLHFATGDATTLGELAEMAVGITESRSEIAKTKSQTGFVSRFVGDPSRALETLGFRCEIGLRRGIEQLALAMREPADIRHAEFPIWQNS